jgi:hypothetical protein
MGSYGRETYDTIGGLGLTLTADGAPVAKVAGVTLAWAGVPVLAADYTFKHSDIARAGEKVIRYGTILCRVIASATADEVGKFIPYAAGGTLTGTSQVITPAAATGSVARTISVAEGDVFAVNESLHENDRLSDHPAAIDGGRVYRRRLLVVGYGDGTGADNDNTPPNSGGAYYAGAAAENAADLAALGLIAVPAATFKTALPHITFVTES